MNRIREARKRAGIKQVDLCARLGISQGALSGWENGKYDPGRAGWLSLSEVLGVSVDYLMGSDSKGFGVSSDMLVGQKEKAPTQEGERKRINTITIAGRDGSYVVKQLTDEQLQAFKTMFEHLPQVEDDL